MSYTLKFLNHLGPDGFHRVAYREWGNADNDNVLICVHGISRRGADFDFIAEALSSTYRVLCPDMPGRGDSDWMDDKSTYAMPLYQSVCAAVLARALAQSPVRKLCYLSLVGADSHSPNHCLASRGRAPEPASSDAAITGEMDAAMSSAPTSLTRTD